MSDLDEFWPANDAPLSAEEARELEDTLQDGFTDTSQEFVASFGVLESIFDEPFWGARLRGTPSMLKEFQELREELTAEGLNEAQIEDRFLTRIESDPDMASDSWYRSNPFSFSTRRLEEFFTAQCEKSLGDLAGALRENGGQFRHIDLVHSARPFSRTWFEIHIVNEMRSLRILEKQLETRARHAEVAVLIQKAAIVGRLIESYRWRFAYGGHALRGKKVVTSAAAGGSARAKKLSTATSQVLDAMSPLIQGGHSIARASELVHKRGFGSSAAANAKLWQRHMRK